MNSQKQSIFPIVMSKERDLTFDVVRALCILEIVCFWHLTNYIDMGNPSKDFWLYSSDVTVAVLGAFTFMSGYFLKKYKIETVADVKRFYINRVKRFWLLYFFASLTLYVASYAAGQPWYPSATNFILSLFGLTVFFQPLPSTLWYMVMIMLFYIITPIILCFRNISGRIIAATLIFMVFLFIDQRGWVDERVLCYYPMYALGLIVRKDTISWIKKHALLSVFLGTVFVCLVSLLLSRIDFSSLLICIASFPVFLGLSELMAKSSLISIGASFISYSSLNMYLFHRHFYLGFLILWHSGSVGGIREATFPLWFAFVVVCPFMIAFCYYSQRLYDKSIKRWWS